ncbi:hypothetical protein BH11PSE1_BH11PSE1_00770 [soil metagenome]
MARTMNEAGPSHQRLAVVSEGGAAPFGSTIAIGDLRLYATCNGWPLDQVEVLARHV